MVADGQSAMIKSLIKRLDIDGVYFINNTKSFKENGGSVIKTENSATMELYYVREVPLFGNLTLVAEFDKSFSN